MFYRRKVILALLQLMEGKVDKISLQKLLFLFTSQQKKAEYDFIPYKYGCFSYSLNADLSTMVKKGLLSESPSHFVKEDEADYIKTLKLEDRKLLSQVKTQYGNMSANTLMKHTYVNFPYWAINSVKAQDILSEEQLQKVISKRPNGNETILFTIGYEGISLEEYLNRLIKNDVKVLVDVRKNPLSMKFGFSKSLLQKYCNSIGIEYVHFPEVGIHSDQRQTLNTQEDYDCLFEIYKKDNLSSTSATQEKIIELLKSKERIALTCFESNICQCHRKHLAESIEKMFNFKYKVKHI